MTGIEKDFLFYKPYADIFCKSTGKLIDVFEKFPRHVAISEDFSNLLLKIYQCYMLDLFPGATRLVENQNFFSFSILCRSALDITVQIMWILSMEPTEEKDKAIKIFLNFNGKGEYTNKKEEKITTHRWQEIVLEDRFNYDQVIKRLGLHCGNNNMKSTFDYLSKIIHWNPIIINKLVGAECGNLAFGPERLNMFLVSAWEFIGCSIKFSIIFLEHFHPKEPSKHMDDLCDIQKLFCEEIKAIELISNSSDES